MEDKPGYKVFTNSYNGKNIYRWVIRNLPPLSWNILAVRIGEKFIQQGIDPYNISEKTMFNTDLVQEIRVFVKSYYDKELPLK